MAVSSNGAGKRRAPPVAARPILDIAYVRDIARIRRLISEILSWLEKEYMKTQPMPELPVEEKPDDKKWERWLGKESGLSALTKLMQLLIKLREADAPLAPEGQALPEAAYEPLSEAEWELMRQFFREQEDAALPPSDR